MKVQPGDVTIKEIEGTRRGVASPECPCNLPIVKSCLLPSEGYFHGQMMLLPAYNTSILLCTVRVNVSF